MKKEIEYFDKKLRNNFLFQVDIKYVVEYYFFMGLLIMYNYLRYKLNNMDIKIKLDKFKIWIKNSYSWK